MSVIVKKNFTCILWDSDIGYGTKLLRKDSISMDRTQSIDHTFMVFSAILPWEHSIEPPWLE